MMRYLLFLLFFVLLMADMLGLNLSLAPGLSVKNAFLYLVFLGIAVETALARNRHFELPSVIATYSVYVFYSVFTFLVVALVMDYPRYSIVRSAITLKGGPVENLLVLLVFYYGILNSRHAFWLLKAMLWSVILANVFSVADVVLNLNLTPIRPDGRIGGPIGESNQYAAFLGLFLPGVVALAVIEAGWRRALAILGVAVSAVALLMTTSRGGIVGVIAGGLIALFFLRRFVSGTAVVAYVAGGLLVGVVAFVALQFAGYEELFRARVVDVSARQSGYEVSSGRTVIWGAALATMMNTPVSLITGFGWDTYRAFNVTGFAPHNSYLRILFESGIVGLALVLFTFGNVMRVARAGIQNADAESFPLLFAFIFGLACMLVAIFFVDLSSMPWLFIWAYAGTVLRLAVAQVAQMSPADGRNVFDSVPTHRIVAGSR